MTRPPPKTVEDPGDVEHQILSLRSDVLGIQRSLQRQPAANSHGANWITRAVLTALIGAFVTFVGYVGFSVQVLTANMAEDSAAIRSELVDVQTELLAIYAEISLGGRFTCQEGLVLVKAMLRRDRPDFAGPDHEELVELRRRVTERCGSAK